MKQLKAVGVRYEEGWPAPLILLKSHGRAAQRVLDAAKSLGIEIIQEKSLSDALYLLPEGSFIPEEYFKIMATILSVVYGKDKK
ncbi:MAG: hypothetical protein A2Z96_05330 [Spirochaetes bacterium GWB1_48_6]|nr:MAG: hypothetical protein A2Z96_05330 [Spirochaetes bacterium GWB1_48_6]